MTARILVVDDVVANVKLLEARLTAEYFDVTPAYNGQEALDLLLEQSFDIILLDVMMPGIDGLEVCRRVKSDVRTQHIPVVMVTALDNVSDRIAGLNAGADDFLTKPVDKLALTTRVRNLTRLKALNDELRLRSNTTINPGAENDTKLINVNGDKGHILAISDSVNAIDSLARQLTDHGHKIDVETDPEYVISHLSQPNSYETVIVNLHLENFDALRLCSQIRTLEATRNLPIILIAQKEDKKPIITALELGVNDYILDPFDHNELLVRVRSNIQRKRYTDQLRSEVTETIEMAYKDAMTGLYNRRFMEMHLEKLTSEAIENNKKLSLIITDIDYFKSINDTYGHDVGDLIIREFGKVVEKNIREFDLACRFGGEEFVILLPDTDLRVACYVAERMRQIVASFPININQKPHVIGLTISLGIAALSSDIKSGDELMKKADNALYKAKRTGRNKIAA